MAEQADSHESADRVSLLGVSADRLPYYLPFFALSVAFLVGVAVGKGGASIEEILKQLWSVTSRYLPVIVSVMIAVEGVIVTLGEIRTRQKVRDAERRAENRVINRAIRALEEAGVTEGARIVRERIYGKGSSNNEK